MRYRSLAVLAGLLCTAAPLRAQGNLAANEVHNQNDCRLAAQVVRTGHPAPHREWAYTVLPECVESGPAAIASMWSGVRRLDADEFALLIRSTRGLRDRRIYTALQSFGETPSASVDARLHALALLIVYGNPVALIFTPSDLRTPPDEPMPMGGAVSHDNVAVGSQPVGDVREDLRTYYLELKESDPDAVIRNAARILLRRIR